MIKTIRSRGYQFVAQVSELPGDSDVKGRRSADVLPKNTLVIGSLLFILVLAIIGITIHTSSTPDLAKLTSRQLAVLPFKNVKSDPEIDYLGFAVADQVIGNLANS